MKRSLTIMGMPKDPSRLRETFLSIFVTLALLGSGDCFLDSSEGQRFLKAYCNSFGYTNVNIFLPNTEDGGSFSVGALRSLWKAGIHSISVRKVDSRSLHENEYELLSSGLNVGFIRQPQDLEFFTELADQSAIRNYPWLLLGNVSKILESMDNAFLMLDNQVTFASLNTTTQDVELNEVYNLAADLPPKIQPLGEWTSSGQLNVTKTSWIQRRSNLTGLHFRCTTLEQPPFLYLSKPDQDLNVDIKGGYIGDVWHTLQERLGFSYSCRQPADGLWGNPTNGVWNGLVKDLIENKADVVIASLDNNNARIRVVDFLLGLKEIGYQLVVRRPGLMDSTWTSFTSELVPASWIATIFFAVLVPPLLSFCSNYSPKETEKISLKDAYILTVGAFTVQGSWLEVKSISTRIVFITIFLTTLLVYAHYTSALVSLLTVASTSTKINSLQSLLEDGTYSFGFLRDTSIQSSFETSKSGLFHDVWKYLVMGDPNNLPSSDADGMAWVLDSNYVHMIEENQYRAEFSNVCGTMMIAGKYFTQQTGFAVQKGSPVQKIFNTQLMRMLDGGVLSRLWETWQPQPPLCTTDNVVALDIKQLFTAFLLLVLGLVLGIAFLPCERLHWHLTGKGKTFGKSSVLPGKLSSQTSPTSDAFFYSRNDEAARSSQINEVAPTSNAFVFSNNFTYGHQ